MLSIALQTNLTNHKNTVVFDSANLHTNHEGFVSNFGEHPMYAIILTLTLSGVTLLTAQGPILFEDLEVCRLNTRLQAESVLLQIQKAELAALRANTPLNLKSRMTVTANCSPV